MLGYYYPVICIRDVPVEIYGGAMVILEKNSLPSNIKKIKTLPSSTIKKNSLPLEGTKICVPLLYGHIFFIGIEIDPYSDLFH